MLERSENPDLSGDAQRTVAKPATLSGVGLHTGNITSITFKPAPENHGICFIRIDIEGQPRIPVDIDNVVIEDILRQTALGQGNHQIKTVEHVLAAVMGLGIDNLSIEVDGNEPPVGDGSAKPYTDILVEAGVVEQKVPRKYIEIKEPIWMLEDGVELAVIPCPSLEITFKINYPHKSVGIRAASFLIEPENFVKRIAPARTFCFYQDVEKIKNAGLIKGGSLENAIVIGEEGIMNKDSLRFQDEIVRHKIVDLLGDLAFLGAPLKAHVIAVRSGHLYNIKFVRKILENLGIKKAPGTRGISTPVNIQKILEVLPHRYPFLMVDRILEFSEEPLRAVGLKNVTINEPYFQGHFPELPVMPGVLQIETMAQVGGVMLLCREENMGKIPYLITVESAKWRVPVQPGDTLIIESELIKLRGKVGKVAATIKVDNKVVSECVFLFSLEDR